MRCAALRTRGRIARSVGPNQALFVKNHACPAQWAITSVCATRLLPSSRYACTGSVLTISS